MMDKYFEALGSGDFSRFFTADVTWTTIESGEEISGPLPVQDAITALHAQLVDFRTRQLTVSDTSAYIEGSAVRRDGAPGRVAYCVAYDINGDRINAMRAYGSLAALMAPTNEIKHGADRAP